MTRLPSRRLLALALASAIALPAWAQTTEPGLPAIASTGAFTATDIRIDGLQRISAGTVLTYLPIERGDTVDSSKTGEAIRALYKTGFFEDVQLDRQGDILVITVTERPAINKLTLSGNKDIKTEDLIKGLQDIGLAEGETFDRLALDRVTQELTRQYNNRGKYNVEINPTVAQLDRNRVDVTINVKEGKAAKIRHINLVGNEKFENKDILDNWESKESNWLTWYRRDDQYSQREALRRPREAELVLPGPRLRRLQPGLHPGRDQPRQAGHVHHRRRHRGRAVQGLRRQGHRRHRPAEGGNREAWYWSRKDQVFSRAPARIHLRLPSPRPWATSATPSPR